MANESMSELRNLRPLSAFRRNVRSQLGEDGILEEVLVRLGSALQLNKWCVEFGAWDGIHLSNTYHLISSRGYRAVLIEGSPKKYEELCRNIPSQEIIKICAFVTFAGERTLDRILGGTPIPRDFDVLSIDIDGCDYFILESLQDYLPKVICIEYNSTIPNDVEFVQPKDFGIKQGASAKSIAKLATSKGYSLVATTECNLIFVRSELKHLVTGDESAELSDLRDDSQYKTYLFSGFDGTVFSNKPSLTLPWHELDVGLRRLQPLPRFLRRFPDDYSPGQKFVYWFLLLVRFPTKFRRLLAAKFSGGG